MVKFIHQLGRTKKDRRHNTFLYQILYGVELMISVDYIGLMDKMRIKPIAVADNVISLVNNKLYNVNFHNKLTIKKVQNYDISKRWFNAYTS
jgi:hypothetical protein